jgi:hypothetical protein
MGPSGRNSGRQPTPGAIDNTLRLLARIERTEDVLAGWAPTG